MFFKKEREREKKQTYLLCFSKKEKTEREGGREGGRGEEEAQHSTSLPLKTQILVILALMIYKILEETLVP